MKVLRCGTALALVVALAACGGGSDEGAEWEQFCARLDARSSSMHSQAAEIKETLRSMDVATADFGGDVYFEFKDQVERFPQTSTEFNDTMTTLLDGAPESLRELLRRMDEGAPDFRNQHAMTDWSNGGVTDYAEDGSRYGGSEAYEKTLIEIDEKVESKCERDSLVSYAVEVRNALVAVGWA